MGSITIKVDRDRDLYMRWSSIVDAPTHLGTRAEMAEEMLRDYALRDIQSGYAAEQVEQHLARCDETGTTSRMGRPAPGAWEDSGLIWQGFGVLPRAAFGELVERLLLAAPADTMPDVTDLLIETDDD